MRIRHLQGACLTAQLLNGANGALHHLRVRTRVAKGHGSSVGGDRMAAVDGDVTIGDEWSALALAAESKSLQLTNDLERERIVEFQHIDIGRPQSGVAERTLCRPPAHDTIDVVAVIAPAGEVPRGWVLI